MLHSAILAVTLASAACCAWASEVSGTITILEGDALVYRGASRMQAQEGVRIVAGDLVETGAGAFVQIELADLSKIELGPATRMQFVPPARGKSERSLYFLEGFGKLTYAKPDTGLDLRAPLFEIAARPGVVVFDARPTEATVFVERGDARLVERAPGAGGAPVLLNAGDYYKRKAGMRGAVNSPDARALVDKLPRAFRDTLPSRLEKFRGRDVKPREAPGFGYADVEAWLSAEAPIRRQFVQRWRGKAHEPAFRSALIAHLPAHPEWDPILFPEKYLPKEAQAPTPALAGRPASNPAAR
jgi:hypothetical protein